MYIKKTQNISIKESEQLQEAYRRAKQYNGLYQIIKGKMEMLREQNNHWEFALKKLSIWVLKQQKTEIVQGDNLGLLVNKALKTAGISGIYEDIEKKECCFSDERYKAKSSASYD